MPASILHSFKNVFASLLCIALLASCSNGGNAGSADGAASNARLLAQSSTVVVPQSGWWWNPAEGGRGFTLEVQNGSMFMAGFLYEPTGRATWYAAGPTPMYGSTFSSVLTSYRGGQSLGGAYRPVAGTSDSGNVRIVFTDPSHGVMTWPGGTVAIERYSIVPGGAVATPPAGTPEAGWWWNPAEGGRGYCVEIQNGTMFLAGYMYDDAGNPVWYVSGPAQMTDAHTYQGAWLQYGNGQTITSAFKPAAVVNADVGSVGITFGTTRTATLTLPNGIAIPLVRYDFNGLDPVAPSNLSAADWVAQNARAFSGVDPANEDDSDLQGIGDAVGNARIVALGEPSHGNGTVFNHKVRLIKYLHEKKGFDVLMYEAGIFGALRMAQLTDGGASLDAIAPGELADSYANSAEARKMLQYIDSQRAGASPLLFTGMDSHQSGKYARSDLVPMLQAYLSARSSALLQAADWPSYKLQVGQITQNIQTAPAADTQTAFYSFSAALEAALCAAQDDGAVFPNSPGQWCRVVKSLHNQADRFWKGKPNRDEDMAENVKWLMEHTFQGRKVVIWTHIAHAGRWNVGGSYGSTMGQALADTYGRQMYVIDYTASTGTSLNVFTGTTYAISADADGSLEKNLYGLNQPWLFVDSRRNNAPTTLQAMIFKTSEYEYSPQPGPGVYFDGMVYMRKADAVTLTR